MGTKGFVGPFSFVSWVVQGCGCVLLMERQFSKPPGSQSKVWLSGRPPRSARRGTGTLWSHLLWSALCLVSLTQDYELEAEKLRSLLDLENGRSSHVSKRARLQSPATKVREEVSFVGPASWGSIPPGSMACRPQKGTQSGKRGWGPSWVPTVSVGEDDELTLGQQQCHTWKDSLLGVVAGAVPLAPRRVDPHTEG